MSIEIQSISKHFGNTTALDNVSISIDQGHIYGLLGNNGAGKTTLLSIITNRIFADQGTVLVDSEPIIDNDRALGKMFMMGEQNLYPDDMRVNKAFDVTARFYPDFDMAYALDLAKRFGLNTKKKIAALSTGNASIFRLIIALAVNTPYLLLDEPVLGLDAQHRDMFYKLLIEKYSENNCTIIISTHLIQEIAHLLEHILIIHDGRIISNLPREELTASYYTISGPSGQIDAFCLDKQVVSVSNLGGLKTAVINGNHHQAVVPGGLEITSPDLQQLFISLMNKEDSAK